MSEQAAAEQSPVVEKLDALRKEFSAHSERITLRAKQIGSRDDVTPEVKELYSEIADTLLSLQGDLIDGVIDAVQQMPGDDAISMLLVEDADTIGAVIEDYQEMLKGMIADANYASMVPQLKQKLAESDNALALIDEITVGDDAEAPEGEDGGDEAGEGEDEEPN
jgi:hypothetical protein